MISLNDQPDAPDWTATAKPWNEQACCPLDCLGVCERNEEHIIRGEE